MEITLVRHGKPNIQGGAWVAPAQMRDWVASFNRAGIVSERPPATIVSRAQAAATIVCSSLSRSMESAQLLAPNRSILVEDVFREAEMPCSSWRAPKLPASVWSLLFRTGWICGLSADAESLATAKARARAAAHRLISLARDSGSVLLVGHGIMNMLIARQLLVLGAVGPTRPRARYWNCSVYRAGRYFTAGVSPRNT
ncbi:MAG TPA: histidine phosphatase family protein [Steroidobacteraceae bacterium]|jgi:broad specificity phosphatase PhoE